MNSTNTSNSPRAQFPTRGLLPRADTQAGDFVRKHPEYDGRGTVVAILDTGIDPGAQGLQKTTDGKPKVADFVDCTGSGDVHLSEPQKIESDSPLELKGLSGRTLKLNSAWNNPTGEWRLGTKLLYDIIPDTLKDTISRERSEIFKKNSQGHEDSVSLRISELSGNGKNSNEKAELEAQSEALKYFASTYVDQSPILDCVVFHDGEQWRAAIDTTETGDLSDVPALGAYKKTHDIGKLYKRHLFYYTLNFYDDGKILSIVTNVGSHSTHVAGIVAAYHPDEPQNNGVAPGAQLLSLMIGDHRVGSLETGIGLTRAANAIVEHGADLANMSYGEPSATANSGQWVQVLRKEVIRRHRCIFVSSAGNEGPALSTVGAPGGTSDDIVGVGAYVGYEQMKSEYALYDTVKDTVFTWCSRGPTPDGARGVDIYAPGSAIASFPAYTLQRLHLANGTSMSSPNLCGCLALLVSAWKQEFAQNSTERVSPYRIKNAIMATAKQFGDELNAGLIQTDDAWSFIKKHAERTYEDVEYAVNIPKLGNARGIYLRNAEDSIASRHLTVNVSPVFPEDIRAQLDKDKSDEYGQRESQRKFEFEQRVILTATANWVRIPETLYISSEGRSFETRIDATALEPGRLHVAEIRGYDSLNVDRGAIFTVPITVTKPLLVNNSAAIRFPSLRFQPTDIIRRFIDVPRGSTQAKIMVRSTNTELSAPATFYLHCLQLSPQKRFTEFELKSAITIGHSTFGSGLDHTPEQHYVKNMNVVGGNTLEVCIAPFWNQLDTHEVDIEVSFAGVSAEGSVSSYSNESLSSGIVVNGNYSIVRVDLAAPVRPMYGIKPVVSLNKLRTSLRPTSAQIVPLSKERDTHLISGVQIQQLTMDYKYSAKSDNLSVRPHVPAVDSMIYENWVDDVAVYIFDANKKLLSAQIGYTKAFKLPSKGDYLFRVHIRHRSAQDLESLKAIPLVLETTLASEVKLTVHGSHASAFTKTISGPSAIPNSIPRGSRVPIFFNTDVSSSLPKEANPGDVLRGSFSLCSDSAKLLLEYIVPAEEKKPKEDIQAPSADNAENEGKGNEKEPSQAEKDRKAIDEAIRDLRIEWIKKAKDETVRQELIQELRTSHNDHIPALMAEIDVLDPARKILPWAEGSKITGDVAAIIITKANSAIALADSSALAAKLFAKSPKVGDQSAKFKAKEENEKLQKIKKQLISALTSKCRALAYTLSSDGNFADLGNSADEQMAQKLDSYEKSVEELVKWTGDETQDITVLFAMLPLRIAKQQYGLALKPVIEWIKKTPLNDDNISEWMSMLDLRDELVKKIGWSTWTNYFKVKRTIDTPACYARF